MWLQYGLDPNNDYLVLIEYIQRGKTTYQCPYCRGALTTKKGEVLVHHLAHTDQTCRSVADENRELPTLPYYDRFDLHLSPLQLKRLGVLWEHYSSLGKGIPDPIFIQDRALQDVVYAAVPTLQRKRVLEYDRRNDKHHFTALGKPPFGALSLKQFVELQEPNLMGRLSTIEHRAANSLRHGLVQFPEHLTDLRIYRAQYQRILALTLYYLKVQADGQTFYKIGVTRRPVPERIAEIQTELQTHYQTVKLKLQGAWEHRGNVELYFKHRYSQFQHRIANLTEYYQFDDSDQAKAVLTDLRRMPAKVLTPTEVEILAGQPSRIEEQVETAKQAYQAYEKAKARSHSIRLGMGRAHQWGTHIGRPKGAEAKTDFLSKPSSQRAIAALESGLSLRQAAEAANVSVNTIRKVKALHQK